jgi:hypothetical protein
MKRFEGLAVLPAFLLVLGCYNTSSVKNGGLVCGAGDTCPDGYTCQTDGHCWKESGLCQPPLGPVTGCQEDIPANSECDPVCQTGCGCNRCVYAAKTSDFVCETSTPPTTSFIPPLGNCSAPNTNKCAPGSICIEDDVCPSVCYKTCRADADCPTNTHCTQAGLTTADGTPLFSGLFLCSPPAEACNPSGAATCGVPPKPGFGCVFLAGLTGVSDTAATVCDCATLHNVAVGQACVAVPDNCQPGSVCVSGQCHTVCDRLGSGCTKGICAPIFGSKQYGYCPL